MKRIFLSLFSVIMFLNTAFGSEIKTDIISEGEQPQVSVDNKGIIRVVFGRENQIFCSTSEDKGITFSEPVLVARVSNMHLGMTRGPQIASSDHYSVITAMDKSGNIHWFQLNQLSGSWKNMGMINNLKGSAPEGLMSIAADKSDNFYAVWLDTRTGKRNQIYFSSLLENAKEWSKNILAYQSPDGHVCECCKPSIAVQGTEVAIMFRNWLNGSRDLYLLHSSNGGKSFGEAQKLGLGTWKLNGCPMDGGGVVIDSSNVMHTVWQREGIIYYCKPGELEISLGKGRACSITGTMNDEIITLQDNETIKVVSLKDKNEEIVGQGSFLKSVVLPNNEVFCVWEQEGQVKFKKVRNL